MPYIIKFLNHKTLEIFNIPYAHLTRTGG